MNKNIITGVIVLVLIAAVVWWWRSGSVAAVPISTAGTSGPTLELVERLRNLKIDTSFFDDQQFLDLEASPKTSLEGLQKGRSNPFSSTKR